MVKFHSRVTGTVMWVADERVEEYIAAGYKPAADIDTQKPAEVPEQDDPEETKPRSRGRKRS